MRKFLPYAYLLRVPALCALALVAFPLLAIYNGGLSALLENLFDLSARGTMLTTFVAVIASWSLILTGRLVLLNGAARFGTAQFGSADSLSGKVVILAIALAFPAMFVQFARNAEFGHYGWEIGKRVLAVVAGAAAAYTTAFAGLLVAVLLAPAGTQSSALTFPALPLWKRWIVRADKRSPLRGLWLKLQPTLLGLPEFWRAGYIDPRTGFPLSGHWLAFIFGGVTLVLYAGIDLVKRSAVQEARLVFPAFFFVLWLILNLNWVLAFLAFLLDRCRIPLMLPFAALVLIATQIPSNDHYFGVTPATPATPITPAAVLDNRLARGRKLVLVASDGGGIQAAAWSARVLTGLQRDSVGGSTPWPQDFAGSVALVSAVSGGAVGSMFFLNQYHPTFTTPPEQLQQVVDDASGPSIDELAWALIYHDIPRIFWPLGGNPLLDRGLVLEWSWRRRARIHAKLDDWREGVLEAQRPAVIFNSMQVETGVPLLFSTSDIADTNVPGKREFRKEFPLYDVPVVTAVRVASAFPYVSPASSPATGKPEYHLVDGGYFDNYATSSLVAWLFEAVKARPTIPDVLIIRIISFPPSMTPVARDRSGVFQLYAPIAGLFGVRVTSQAIRSNDDLTRLQNRWPSVQVATFQFDGTRPPLSWQMNARQRREIEDEWSHTVDGSASNHQNLERVRKFFGASPMRP